MKLGIPKETRTGETRVAVSPDTVKKLRAKGLEILIEKSAGIDSRR
jgi:NAD(P) transhydrogenase subunit alpha